MLRNQHAKFFTRLALLFVISFTILLYYISRKSDVSTLNLLIDKHFSLKNVNTTRSQATGVNLGEPKTLHLLSKKLKGYSNDSIFRYGNCDEEIKIAVVLCGDRLNQTLVTLKSTVIFSEKPLHFIIIVDEQNRQQLYNKLLRWPVDVLSRLSFEFHGVHFPNGSEGEEWKKLFKLCACQRLFLPSLLQHIDSLIYIDTDVLFMRPVENLWQYFSKMNKSHIAALCPEHEDFATGWYNRFARHPFYEPLEMKFLKVLLMVYGGTVSMWRNLNSLGLLYTARYPIFYGIHASMRISQNLPRIESFPPQTCNPNHGVNSGVMLMNLTRMREFQWETYLPPIMREYKLNIVWGDQDIINIIFHFHPEKLYIFPCEWNYRPDHCMYASVCKTAEKNGIAVIHGNRGVFQNSKQPAFKALYNAMFEFSLGDVPSKLLVPLKKYLFETLNTNCGKHISVIFSTSFTFKQQIR